MALRRHPGAEVSKIARLGQEPGEDGLVYVMSTLECRALIVELRKKATEAISSGASKMSFLDRVKWLYSGGEVEELVDRLGKETDRLWKLLLTYAIYMRGRSRAAGNSKQANRDEIRVCPSSS